MRTVVKRPFTKFVTVTAAEAPGLVRGGHGVGVEALARGRGLAAVAVIRTVPDVAEEFGTSTFSTSSHLRAHAWRWCLGKDCRSNA